MVFGTENRYKILGFLVFLTLLHVAFLLWYSKGWTLNGNLESLKPTEVRGRAKVREKDKDGSRDCGRGAVTSSGYLISLDYSQQTMAAFTAFYHLALLASFLNLSIVEPYVGNNGRLGVPTVNSQEFLKLTDLFDHCQLRHALKSCAKIDFISFNKFTAKAPSNMVFVSFLPSLKEYKQFFSGEEKIVEIDKIPETLNSGLSRWTSFAGDKERIPLNSFAWSRKILIDARPLHSISLSDIKEKLGSIIHQQVEEFGTVTIVLNNWRDIQAHDSFFYWIKGFKSKTCRELNTVAHTDTVINAAHAFARSLNLTHPVIGIHVRGERLLLQFKDDYTQCLQKLREFLKGGATANVSNNSIVLIHDLKKHGSSSCYQYKDCRVKQSNFLSEIKRFGCRVVSFNPSGFHPVLLQSVFTAFVEKEFLSGVDILVTIGKGNYQHSIIERFLNRSGSSAGDNLHRLCL